MIIFDLKCEDSGDRFEAWFRSNIDFEDQLSRGLIECVACGSSRIKKAPMAPRIGRQDYEDLASKQARLLKNSQWVGKEFADHARAMHRGELESRPIHGEATILEAISLTEEGVAIAPLPLPVVPPSQVN